MNILAELVPIPYTDKAKIDRLRSLLVEIQAAWLDNLFDTGQTFSNPEIAEKMTEAVCLMERSVNASHKGIDLKAIASDYELLEQIFIAKLWDVDENFTLDSSSFVGCDLVQMHRFSSIGILKEVQAFRMDNQIKNIMTKKSIKSLGLENIDFDNADNNSTIYPPDEATAYESSVDNFEQA